MPQFQIQYVVRQRQRSPETSFFNWVSILKAAFTRYQDIRKNKETVVRVVMINSRFPSQYLGSRSPIGCPSVAIRNLKTSNRVIRA